MAEAGPDRAGVSGSRTNLDASSAGSGMRIDGAVAASAAAPIWKEARTVLPCTRARYRCLAKSAAASSSTLAWARTPMTCGTPHAANTSAAGCE
eukprot:scaffold23243_cov84-Isochrysis_galbana.AAC.1